MAISYEEALSTLQAMFSDQGYTSHQLDAVLRHFGGHMEHTVETLLSHGGGTPDELIAKLPSLPASGGGSGSAFAANNTGGGGNASDNNAAHNIDADEELARQLQAEDERQQQQRGRSRQRSAIQPSGLGMGMGMGSALGNFPGQERRAMASTVTAPKRPAAKPAAAVTPTRLQPPPGTKGRGTPTVLPSDFLRIPGQKYPVSSSTTTSTTASSSSISDPIASANGPGGFGQMMTDEQMARMLQDELFQEELRNNPEFSHLAGRRNPSARSTVPAGGNRIAATRIGQTTGRSHHGGATGGGGGIGWGERTDFFDRLSDLGDNAKRRFQHFASSWNDPNAQTNRRPLFGGGGSGGQTTTNRGNERRGLLSLSNDLNMDEDEEEEEMDFVGGATGGRDFEMNDVGSGSGAQINWSGDKKMD